MRRALVTGGASPLGAAICRRLVADNHHLLIHAHAGLQRAESLARSITEAGGTAEAFACDVRDVSATAAAMMRLLETGPPQIVVHNAGTHDDGPMAGMRPEQWQSVIDVSLGGFYAVLQPLLLPLIGTRWGRVVAVSSVSAMLGNRGQVNYAAAKAGLIGAVKSLAREVASRGITVNAVAPGVIASPAVDDAMDAKRIAEIVPMRRAGTPEEVAELIGFLCSDKAGYITGQCISINGGMA